MIRPVFAITLLAMFLGQAGAAEIRIVASGAVHDALSKALFDFEKSSSHKIDVTWAGAAVYRLLLSSEKPFDAVIIASADADALIQARKLRSSKVDLAKTGVGIGVRKGKPRPDISTTERVKAMLLEAGSIGYSMGPSGTYVEKLIAKLGIESEVRPRLKQARTGREVGRLIANGEVEIGFQPISELVHAEGVDFVGGLPNEIQSFTVYSFVPHAQLRDEKAIQELAEFLISPAVQTAFQRVGMERP
jgi:molybdate transport system substrate-binding protein